MQVWHKTYDPFNSGREVSKGIESLGLKETKDWLIDGLARPVKRRALKGSEADIADAIDGLDEDSRKRFVDLRESLLTPHDRVKIKPSKVKVMGEVMRPKSHSLPTVLCYVASGSILVGL